MDINNHEQFVVTSNMRSEIILNSFTTTLNERLPELKQEGDIDSG